MSNTRQPRAVARPARDRQGNRVPPRPVGGRRLLVGALSGVVAVTLLVPIALAFTETGSRPTQPGSRASEAGLVTPAQVSTDIQAVQQAVSKAVPLIGGGSLADARYACRVASQAFAKALRDSTELGRSAIPSARAAGQSLHDPAQAGVLAAADCTDRPAKPQIAALNRSATDLGKVALPRR